VINPLCFPSVTICEVNVDEFDPGDVFHADVDLTIVHTLVRFCVHPLLFRHATRDMRKN